MHSQKLHILNIPELDKIFIEIKDYFNFDINYIREKKDLIKKIDEDKKFLPTLKSSQPLSIKVGLSFFSRNFFTISI